MATKSIRLSNGTDTLLPESAVSGSRYCKMADGTLIQWGALDIPANSTNAQLTFPQSFYDTGWGISITPVYTVSAVDIQYSGSTKTGVTVYRLPSNQYVQTVKWIAIGRWKA